MITDFNSKYNDALIFAQQAHKGQVRKGSTLPYILHPMEVSIIASTMTDEIDVMCAALLHDTIEDAGITAQEIEQRFGSRVCGLVLSETENKRNNLPKESTWMIRKQESLKVLEESDDTGVKILWLSDKLANMRSLYRSWLKIGDDAFNIFHQKDKKLHGWYYGTILQATLALSNCEAYKELQTKYKAIFEQ